MYRIEWYDGIESQEDFEKVVKNYAESDYGWNFDQICRLFYNDGNDYYMVELQVPTKTMIDLTEEDEIPWLDIYKINSFEDYDARNELCSTIGCGEIITYENAEQEMLELVHEISNSRKKRDHHSYDQEFIGSSDGAQLVLRSWNKVRFLNFGEDASYRAYIVDDNCEIPPYYRYEDTFESWLKIYDDDSLSKEFNSKYIDVYTAGMRGCIIRLREKEI